MDRTAFFKACVRAIRTRNQATKSSNGTSKDTLGILGRSRSKVTTEFGSKASEVKQSVSKLKEFLLKHRKDYIEAVSHVSSGVTAMSDRERDQIDQDAQTFIRTCSTAIQSLKDEVVSQKNSEQVTEHRCMVLEILQKYLKATCKLFSEQRAIRVKRVVDKKRVSRLQCDSKKESGKTSEINRSEVTTTHSPEITDADVEFTAEEMQTFEQENKQIFDEMNSLVNEVRNIEGRVVEIAKLQEVFTEKVLEQSKQIDHVYETTVKTNENVKEGNENIREAIKNNASFRVWILFFLVMCSFSLLFLDWYS
ncbi:syntaxin-18-like [Dendronephthya gigantea]|uniref:syntaxin-18-like n=1 Tax=Dendronephthya gigantea TaxID=151771 RepID=UPI00106B811D|nr:syntaxin-18-like [Dendronephthya gigantea]